MATIYLSSTYEDLKDFRSAVMRALCQSEYHVINVLNHESLISVAHERRFVGWPRLALWIKANQESLFVLRQAKIEANEWKDHSYDLNYLWPDERLKVNQYLAAFGDARPGVELAKDGLPDIVWIEIPREQVRLRDIGHLFTVTPFRIAKYPVTNEQCEAFLKSEDGFGNKVWWKNLEQSPKDDRLAWSEANAPLEMVSGYEAVPFCRWPSAKARTSIRLSTEWEWQQAATGGDLQRDFPWPGGWDSGRCNSEESRLSHTTAVGMYPRGPRFRVYWIWQAMCGSDA